MAAPRKPRKANPIREALEKADELDRRRQRQIQNQSESITRLLVLNQVGPDPEAATKEVVKLNELLAAAQGWRDDYRKALEFVVDCYNEDPERLGSAVESAAELLGES